MSAISAQAPKLAMGGSGQVVPFQWWMNSVDAATAKRINLIEMVDQVLTMLLQNNSTIDIMITSKSSSHHE